MVSSEPIAIRPLSPEDWCEFRRIRLFALESEPGVFSAKHEDEINYTELEWRRRAHSKGRQAFGLFSDNEIIGITAVVTSRDDPSGRTALLAMSYLLPEYRGRGLANLLYEARLSWIHDSGAYDRSIVSHRESNTRSAAAMARHGFQCIGREPRVWPDGSTEDEILYERRV